ncbi:unnamed protein product, partial [Rotaria sordida]
MIIEEAFQTGQKHAVLDGYTIDFKEGIQISNNDRSKQHPVKRITCSIDDHPVREERFTYTPISPKQPFAGRYGWISPFIRATVKHLNITKENLPSKDATVIPMIVEKAADGIIQEGKKIEKQREAEWIAKMLREKQHASMKEVWKSCAYLYSLEGFLYKKMNETMRLIGDKDYEQDWRDKVPTLGPFCLLLWDNPASYKTTKQGTILYRGAKLSDELVSMFKEDCKKKRKNKPIRSFQSFTSCSRDSAVAEMYGNTLFIMTIKHAFSVDLKACSQYPDEEEELVSPGVCFTVERVEFDQEKDKYVIYLELIQQYNQIDHEQISECLIRHSDPIDPDSDHDAYYADARLRDLRRDRCDRYPGYARRYRYRGYARRYRYRGYARRYHHRGYARRPHARNDDRRHRARNDDRRDGGEHD